MNLAILEVLEKRELLSAMDITFTGADTSFSSAYGYLSILDASNFSYDNGETQAPLQTKYGYSSTPSFVPFGNGNVNGANNSDTYILHMDATSINAGIVGEGTFDGMHVSGAHVSINMGLAGFGSANTLNFTDDNETGLIISGGGNLSLYNSMGSSGYVGVVNADGLNVGNNSNSTAGLTIGTYVALNDSGQATVGAGSGADSTVHLEGSLAVGTPNTRPNGWPTYIYADDIKLGWSPDAGPHGGWISMNHGDDITVSVASLPRVGGLGSASLIKGTGETRIIISFSFGATDASSFVHPYSVHSGSRDVTGKAEGDTIIAAYQITTGHVAENEGVLTVGGAGKGTLHIDAGGKATVGAAVIVTPSGSAPSAITPSTAASVNPGSMTFTGAHGVVGGVTFNPGASDISLDSSGSSEKYRILDPFVPTTRSDFTPPSGSIFDSPDWKYPMLPDLQAPTPGPNFNLQEINIYYDPTNSNNWSGPVAVVARDITINAGASLTFTPDGTVPSGGMDIPVGQVFTILTGVSPGAGMAGITGRFAHLSGYTYYAWGQTGPGVVDAGAEGLGVELPKLRAGLAWEVVYGSTSVQLRVVSMLYTFDVTLGVEGYPDYAETFGAAAQIGANGKRFWTVPVADAEHPYQYTLTQNQDNTWRLAIADYPDAVWTAGASAEPPVNAYGWTYAGGGDFDGFSLVDWGWSKDQWTADGVTALSRGVVGDMAVTVDSSGAIEGGTGVDQAGGVAIWNLAAFSLKVDGGGEYEGTGGIAPIMVDGITGEFANMPAGVYSRDTSGGARGSAGILPALAAGEAWRVTYDNGILGLSIIWASTTTTGDDVVTGDLVYDRTFDGYSGMHDNRTYVGYYGSGGAVDIQAALNMASGGDVNVTVGSDGVDGSWDASDWFTSGVVVNGNIALGDGAATLHLNLMGDANATPGVGFVWTVLSTTSGHGTLTGHFNGLVNGHVYNTLWGDISDTGGSGLQDLQYGNRGWKVTYTANSVTLTVVNIIPLILHLNMMYLDANETINTESLHCTTVIVAGADTGTITMTASVADYWYWVSGGDTAFLSAAAAANAHWFTLETTYQAGYDPAAVTVVRLWRDDDFGNMSKLAGEYWPGFEVTLENWIEG